MIALLALTALAEPVAVQAFEAVAYDLPATPGETVWSPDGRWLAVRLDTVRGPTAWGLVPMTSPLPAPLSVTSVLGASSSLDSFVGTAVWAPEERLLFAAAATGGTQTLWLASVVGGFAEPLFSDFPGQLDAPTIDSEASVMAFVRSHEGPADVWVLARGMNPQQVLVATDVPERDPVLRADGTALAFVREEAGGDEIVVADVRLSKDYVTSAAPKKKKKKDPAPEPEPVFVGWVFDGATERAPVPVTTPIGRPAWVAETLVWFAEPQPQTWRIERLEADGTIGVVAEGVRGATDASPAVAGKWLAWVSADDRLFVGQAQADAIEIASGLQELAWLALGLRGDRLFASVVARRGDARAVYVLDLTEALPR